MRLPARLSKRRRDSHKGDFGHVFILAGSRRFVGAACLCAQSAIRSGAGLVTLGLPKSLFPIAARKLTEVMFLPLPETPEGSLSGKAYPAIKRFLKKSDVLLLGPGLSDHRQTQVLVRRVVADAALPLVIDADALNALVGHLEILKHLKKGGVLTPHPGEMARLLGVAVSDVQRARKKVAKAFALRYNMTLVLKGHRTVVVSGGKQIFINPTGNPGMATAGSGDVLSGMIAAFLAQGLAPFAAAQSGVYLHGLAGDLAARDKTEACLIASDLIAYLPEAFKKARQQAG